MKIFILSLSLIFANHSAAFGDQHIIGSELIIPTTEGAKILSLEETWISDHQVAHSGFAKECTDASKFLKARIDSEQSNALSTMVLSDTYLVQDEVNGQHREYWKRVSNCLLVSSIENLPFRTESFGRMSATRATKLATQLYQDKNVIAVVRTKVSSWNHVRMQLDVIYNR